MVTELVYDAYGQVLDRADLPGTTPADLRLGHKGLFFDRLDGGVADPMTGLDTRRLEAGSALLGYVRNRSLHTQWGRWLQRDPNATGVVVQRKLPAMSMKESSGRLSPDDPLISHVIYFDGKPAAMPALVQRCVRLLEPRESPRVRLSGNMRRFSDKLLDSFQKSMGLSSALVEAEALEGNERLWSLVVERPGVWSVCAKEPSDLNVLCRTPGLLLVHRVNATPDSMLETSAAVFDAADSLPNVWSGFAAVGTNSELGFGKCFTDLCQPASWRTSVEETEWQLWEGQWGQRLRNIYWGTYLGPRLAAKIPAALFMASDEFAAKRRIEPLIRRALRGGGLALFLTRTYLDVMGMDQEGWNIRWPAEPEILHAAWLRVELRKLGLL